MYSVWKGKIAFIAKTNIFSNYRSLRDLKSHFSLLMQAFLYVSFLNRYFLDFHLSLNPHFLFNYHFHEKGNIQKLIKDEGV